jgi:hypothetical protein
MSQASSECELDVKSGTNKAGEGERLKQTRRYIRANLARDLWNEYNKPETSQSNKIKIATVLAKLTDKKKAPVKPIFG